MQEIKPEDPLTEFQPHPKASFCCAVGALKEEVERGSFSLGKRPLQMGQSGKDGELPHRPPLRTVRKSFPLYGSSTLKPQLV